MQTESTIGSSQNKRNANQNKEQLLAQPVNLLILGGGSFGQVILEVAEAMGCYGEIAFLDDDPEVGADPLADYKEYRTKFHHAYAAFGNNELRSMWMEQLEAAGYILPTLIHPSALISPTVKLGHGVSVLPKACIHTKACIAHGCIVGLGVLIDHNVIMGKYSLIQTGSVVAAHSTIPPFSSTKPGSVIKVKSQFDELNLEAGV